MAVSALALALIPVGVMTLTIYDTRYLTPFLPLWALAAALGAETLSGAMPRWSRRPNVWMGALLLLLLPSLGPALSEETRSARALDRVLADARAALSARSARPGEAPRLIVTDAPDFVVWTTRRPALWLTRAEVERLIPCGPGEGEPASGEASPCRGAGQDTWFLGSN